MSQTGEVLRVVLVDDSAADRLLMTALLEQAFEAVDVTVEVTAIATSADAARDTLAALSSEGPRPVVVLDLGLPDSRGSSTLDGLGPSLRDYPHVVLSHDLRAVRQLQDEGVVALSKDDDLADLPWALLRMSRTHPPAPAT